MSSDSFTHPEMSGDEVSARLADAGFCIGPAVNVRRTVLDTFDGRLSAAGLRLELREEDSGELLLSERRSPADQLAVTAVSPVDADPDRSPFRARLAPVIGVRALIPLMTVTARRTVAVRRDGAGKIRVAVAVQDRVLLGGSQPASLGWGVEVEALQGYAKDADQARALLASLGLTSHGSTLLDLVAEGAGVDLRGYEGSPTVPLEADEPARDGFRRVLVRLADIFDANWEGTVNDVDPEFLHDLRVAVRRTRSVLAQGRHVVASGDRDRFRHGFAWLGEQTGPARDLDVYVTEWDRYVAPLGSNAAALLAPLRSHIVSLRQDEHERLARALHSEPCRDLRTAWCSWLRAGGDGTGTGTMPRDAGRPLGEVVVERMVAAQDQVLARGRGIGPRSPAEDLHELRKDAKKLRYLLECFASLLAGGPRKAFVQHLKALQDNLGEHQDTEVHASRLREMSKDLYRRPETTADTMLAMGQLSEQLDRRRQAARDEFSERFAAYDTKRTRRAFADLLSSAGLSSAGLSSPGDGSAGGR